MDLHGGLQDDMRVLTCDGIQWERLGPAVMVPNALWGGRDSALYFNFGQRAWSVVQNNKPQPEAAVYWASACPRGEGASPSCPQLTTEYALGARNYLGTPVLKVRYAFLVQPGGPAGSSGQWISRVSVEPREVSTAWGWSVGLEVVTEQPREYGEAGAALAVLPVRIAVVAETKIKQLRDSRLFLVAPSGVFTL